MSETITYFLSEISVSEVLISIAIIFVATAIQYAMGVGFGTIVAPLLAIINLNFVPVATLILTFITSVGSLYSEFDKVEWVQLRNSIYGRITGAIIASAVLLTIVNEKTFTLIFGLIMGFFVLLSISGLKIPFNLNSIRFGGTISGFTATITGVGGPPMALVYQDQDAQKARPTLQAFFVFASFVSMTALIIIQQVEKIHLLATLALLPGLLGGPLLGPTLRRYADHRFKWLIIAVTAVSAIVLIVRGLG